MPPSLVRDGKLDREAAAAEIRPAAHDVAHVNTLRLRLARRQHRHRRTQQSKRPVHLSSSQISFEGRKSDRP